MGNESVVDIVNLEHDSAAIAKKVLSVDASGNPVTPSAISKDLEGGGINAVGTTAIEVTFIGTTTSILITADNSNSGTLYVGKSDVTSLGANAFDFLLAGESVSINYD
ncbi:hypothetical protein LCGC14_2424010, partial [marine sediment metagenome]